VSSVGAAADVRAPVRALYERLWTEGRLEQADDVLAAGFAGHVPGRPNLDREGYLAEIRAFRRGFPDLRVVVLDQFDDGARIVTEFGVTGNQSGPILGVPATHKRIGFKGLSLSRLEDGRIIEHWDEWDRHVWLEQIGVLPSISML
jgi:steroid delta-isomerase-like uncharacterized protein